MSHYTSLLGLMVAIIVAASTQVSEEATATIKPKVCPYNAPCQCVGDSVDCSGKRLTRIPGLKRGYKAGEFTKVDFSNNKITMIYNANLPTNITHVDLRGNPVRIVQTDAFTRSAYHMKEVRFQNPAFTVVPEALKKLVVLETLEISNTNITDWKPTILEQLGNTLQSIDFSNTDLKTWPAWIKYMAFLREVRLNNNHLNNILHDALKEWRNELTILQLSNNGLNTVNYLAGLKKLQHLDLSMNQLSNQGALSIELISVSQSLVSLNLHGNRYGVTPELSDFVRLTDLDASNNYIYSVDADSFPVSLKTLNLDNNRLSQIPQAIRNLNGLTNLSIRNSKIQKVNGDNLPSGNSYLLELDLAGNPIDYIHRHAFESLIRLQSLNISSTALTSLPLALSHLGHLQKLQMENIPSLLCKCTEKDLAPWYNRIKASLSVTGKCGILDITEFLKRFQTDC